MGIVVTKDVKSITTDNENYFFEGDIVRLTKKEKDRNLILKGLIQEIYDIPYSIRLLSGDCEFFIDIKQLINIEKC